MRLFMTSAHLGLSMALGENAFPGDVLQWVIQDCLGLTVFSFRQSLYWQQKAGSKQFSPKV